MRYRTSEQINPLQEYLERINDCVETFKAVKDISMLLNLNREVNLALV